jgi:hypothetical protein
VDATDEIGTRQPRSGSQEFTRAQSRAPPDTLAASNLRPAPTVYLIALKKGVIRPAPACSDERKVLHYVRHSAPQCRSITVAQRNQNGKLLQLAIPTRAFENCN